MEYLSATAYVIIVITFFVCTDYKIMFSCLIYLINYLLSSYYNVQYPVHRTG